MLDRDDDEFIDRYLCPAAKRMGEHAVDDMVTFGVPRSEAERIWREVIESIRISYSGKKYDHEF